jgi:hypothetical protein
MMKRLLRSAVIFAAASLCLCVCSSVYSGKAVQAASTQPGDESAAAGAPASPDLATVTIPGPLRSFMRMAAISQKVSPTDVLPLLARNVFMQGYQRNVPTEFLILLGRYVDQARELQILAGDSNTIHVTNCDDAGTLIQILGYRLREGCGQKNFYLDTANPEKAFLTIDSGFPLTDLEEALQKAWESSNTSPAENGTSGKSWDTTPPWKRLSNSPPVMAPSLNGRSNSCTRW